MISKYITSQELCLYNLKQSLFFFINKHLTMIMSPFYTFRDYNQSCNVKSSLERFPLVKNEMYFRWLITDDSYDLAKNRIT
jgi:hypothetical protein